MEKKKEKGVAKGRAPETPTKKTDETRRNAARKVIGKARMEAARAANKGRKKPNRPEKKPKAATNKNCCCRPRGVKVVANELFVANELRAEQLKATIFFFFFLEICYFFV